MNKAAKVVKLKAKGLSPGEIAEETGISERNVAVMLSSPMAKRRVEKERRYQKEVAEEEDPVRSELKTSAPDAARRLSEILTSTDEKEARLAASEILDRSGYSRKEEIAHEMTIMIPEEQAAGVQETLQMLPPKEVEATLLEEHDEAEERGNRAPQEARQE